MKEENEREKKRFRIKEKCYTPAPRASKNTHTHMYMPNVSFVCTVYKQSGYIFLYLFSTFIIINIFFVLLAFPLCVSVSLLQSILLAERLHSFILTLLHLSKNFRFCFLITISVNAIMYAYRHIASNNVTKCAHTHSERDRTLSNKQTFDALRKKCRRKMK